MIIAAIVLFVVAVAIVGTTVAAAGGILRLNTVAGIRIPSLLASQSAWEAGHLAALLPMTIAGVIAAAGGFVVLYRPGSGGVLAVVIILMLALIAFGVVRADRAARGAV
ncbi:SdpI family protein [Frondihabitans australicus]|uniref:SdpI/YhfL family protein n=1 Tax=Frondihabitans australicus TaxID=386892 RepID=A0A495IJ77_9MICO|nr:SdpI family protein [Frondihabitans australicus]RKR76027.1 SdpI/YhfL family protein [Frondihabitans australicus]